MSEQEKYTPGKAESSYQRLQWRRDPFLTRAREMALLTIPMLFPLESTDTSFQDIQDPSQSAGSRGVNNLSAKLLLALLPPNMPFFRMELSPQIKQKLSDISKNTPEGQPDPKTELERTLAQYEYNVYGESERIQLRPAAYQCFRHLIVGGNVLLNIPNKGPVRYFPLSAYVVRRDPSGNPLEIYVHERVSPLVLPDAILEQIQKFIPQPDDGCKAYDDSIDLYTGVCRKDGQWTVWQETCGVVLEEGAGTYNLDENQWIPLRFSRIDGEDYGRGMVEDYAGDLKNLEVLSDALAQGALAASKVLFLIKPNSTVSPKDLAEAPNCGFVEGNAEDVECLQVQKQADFSVAKDMVQNLRSDLGFVFLLNSAVQRDGDRVTAEEIRYVAQELENSLGGVYSLLAEEFQRVLINRLISRLAKTQSLPVLPSNMVRPVIITGLDALGRGQELARIERSCQMITELLGPAAVPKYVRPEKLAAKIFTSNGVVDNDVVRSSKEIQAMEAQEQQAALAQSVAPHAVKAMGDAANTALQSQMQAQQQQPDNQGVHSQ